MTAPVERLTDSAMGDVTQSPSLSISPTDLAPQTTTWILHNDTYAAPIADQSVNLIILGVSAIAVFVIILLMMVMVLRYIAHQKGTYYTNEEDLAFKSDPEVQDVSESPEDSEDPEDPEDPKDPEDPEDPKDPEDPEDPKDPEDPEEEEP